MTILLKETEMIEQEARELSWSQIKEQALKRDNYTCQGRKCKGKCKILNVHHSRGNKEVWYDISPETNKVWTWSHN
jgi:hypothetical protein